MNLHFPFRIVHSHQKVFRHAITTAVVSILLLAFPVGAAYASPDECETFSYLQLKDSDNAFIQHKSAVIRIKGPFPSQKGTGFLIDAARGLVITAAHVVSQTDDSGKVRQINDKEIFYGFPALTPTKAINMTVLKVLANDIALLQIVPPDKLDEIPFELGAVRILENETYTYGGYQENDLTPVPIHGPIGKVLTSQGAWRYELGSNVFEGYSGGPVVDSRGLVLGIVIQNRGTDKAIIQPVRNFVDELAISVTTQDAEKLVDQFAALRKNDSGDYLFSWFRQNSKNRLNNLELTLFLKALDARYKDKTDIPRPASKFLWCPIYYGASDRGLEQPLSWIVHLLPDPAPIIRQALASYNSGKLLQSQGQFELARGAWENAETLYGHAVISHLRNAPHLPSALCSLPTVRESRSVEQVNQKLEQYDLARNVLPETNVANQKVCSATTKDNALGKLLRLHGETRLQLAQLMSRPYNYDSIIDEVALASSVSSGTEYAKNIELYGDVLQLSGDFEKAIRAYATVWKEGVKSKNIQTKFANARDKVGASISAYNIETTPPLGGTELDRGRRHLQVE